MACGLPVIANAAGALPEVVGTDGSAGRLVPPRDPRALAAAIARRARRAGPRRAHGRAAARARVQRVFQLGAGAPRSSCGVFEEAAACCSPSISSGLRSAAASACSTRAAARAATASARSSAARTWSGSTSTSRRCAARRGALRFRGRGAGPPRRDAAGRRLPPALRRRDASTSVICSEVMEHVHDYRARGARAGARAQPGGRVAVTIPTATSEHLYLRARRRLLRVARAATSGSSARASSRAALARAGPRDRRASASRTRCTRPTGCCARSAGLPHADESRARARLSRSS